MVNTLRDRRRQVGLTQQDLADRAGVSRSMVRLLESGYQPRRASPVRERIQSVLASLEGSGADTSGQQSAPSRRIAVGMDRAGAGSAGSDRLLHERPVDSERGE